MCSQSGVIGAYTGAFGSTTVSRFCRLERMTEDSAECSCWLGRQGPVLPHPLTVALDSHHVAVVEEGIDQGRGNHVIPRELPPLLD